MSSAASSASTTTPAPLANSKRCPTCEIDRPPDWFQIKVPGSQGSVTGTAVGCKQCREKKAAYMRRYRKKKATTKSSEPRSVSENQLAVNNPTPNLLDQRTTSTSTSATSAQEDDEKTQKSFASTKLLDQNEIDAAADRLLDLVKDLQDDDDDDEDEEEH